MVPVSVAMLVGIFTALTTGSCHRELSIFEPTYSAMSENSVRLEVQLQREDAIFIKNEEVYLTLTAHDCESGANRFPAKAFVGRFSVSDFNFPIAGERVTFHGDVPVEVFNRIDRPCVVLEGGGHYVHTVSSRAGALTPKAK